MTSPGTRTILRGIAIVLAAACFMGAGALALVGLAPLAIQPTLLGGLIVVGVAFERWRYKPSVTGVTANFVATPERFIDTDTGRPVQVFIDPATGERRYVER